MRQFLALLTLTVGSLTLGSLSLMQAELSQPNFSSEVAVGYRHDNFEWGYHFPKLIDISGTATPTNKLSKHTLFKMKMENIQIYELSTQAAYTSCNNYYARLTASGGKIFDGTGRSSSYTDSVTPKLETSRIREKVERGHVIDFSAGLGYQFTSNGQKCTMTPVVGGSYHEQHYHFNHGRQVLNELDAPPILGKLSDLHIKYKPRWYGVFVGTDFLVTVDIPCFLLFGSLEYHWNMYRAKGDWNYQNAFINKFTQHGHGQGFLASLGGNYYLGNRCYLGLVGTYRNLRVHKGKHYSKSIRDRLNDPDQLAGTLPLIDEGEHTRLKNTHWNSWSLALSVNYRFFD